MCALSYTIDSTCHHTLLRPANLASVWKGPWLIKEGWERERRWMMAIMENTTHFRKHVPLYGHQEIVHTTRSFERVFSPRRRGMGAMMKWWEVRVITKY